MRPAARRPRLASSLAATLVATSAAWTVTVTSSAPWAVLPMSRPTLLYTEVPPVLLTVPAPLPGGGGCPRVDAPSSLALYLSTGYSGLCVANATALNVAPGAPPLGFGDASTCSVPVSGESWRNWPPDDVPSHTEWFRNYDGIMQAVHVPAPDALLLVRHGEHKNELNWFNGGLYQGLINADVDAHECFSGFHNGTFSDCQAAYNAFVSASLLQPFSTATCFGLGPLGNSSAVDLGPIAWPRDGYLNVSNGKASYGVRQPGTSLSWDGSLILFYIDNGFDTADVWVGRAPAGAALSSDSFRAYNALTRAWDLPLLPAGFDKGDVMASLRAGSPAGAPGSGGAPAFPLAPSAGAVHAAAARLTVGGARTALSVVVYDIVNYTQCFGGGEAPSGVRAGVGSRLLGELERGRARGGVRGPPATHSSTDCVPPWRLFLRVTEDFVVYSEPVELARYAAPGWGAAPLAYPTLLSADGSRADVVDADGFFVLGTCAQEGGGCGSTDGPLVTAARVSIAVAER